MPWQEDDSWKDVGSNAGKEHLLAKSALKSTCLIISYNFLHDLIVCCVNCLMC